jgi:hypothetical protein
MSTYSPDLRIELLTAGAQAGTWGDTTNDTFAYLLESAITGYQNVPIVSTSQALSYINGASATASDNQSVYAMLSFSGATAATSIYAPPVSKQYTIWNNSGYAITIYNSNVIGNTTAAGTGVTIADGVKTQVWSDGVNFYNVQAQSLAALALSAIYPVGSIYTSTSATSPASTFGFGTWVAFGAGRVMIGVGTGGGATYAGGATGGSKDAVVVDHTHTFSATSGAMSANASHAHGPGLSGFLEHYPPSGDTLSRGGSQSYRITSSTATTNTDHTHSVSGTTAGASSGVSGTNANLQPYIAVYMWERTA